MKFDLTLDEIIIIEMLIQDRRIREQGKIAMSDNHSFEAKTAQNNIDVLDKISKKLHKVKE